METMKSNRTLNPGGASVLASQSLLWFLLGLAALLFLQSPAFAADAVTTDFNSANDLYAQGKFSEAATLYEQVLHSGATSAPLYYNLGNAWFKSGHHGRAIAAYLQALKLAPRDPDVRANIQFVRNQVQGPTASPGRWERALERLTVNEWTALTFIPFWIALLLIVVIQFRPAWKPLLGNFILASALATIVLGLCLAAVLSSGSDERAVVVLKDAPVRFGPLDDSPTALTVQDGAEVNVVDHKDSWLLVNVGNRNGWIKRDQVFLPENFKPQNLAKE